MRPVDLVKQYIDLKTLKKIDPKIAKQFKRTQLNGGELLLSVRGSVGLISIAGASLKGSNVTRGIVPIWFDNQNHLFFYYLYMNSAIQNEVKALAKGATLIQINLSDLRALNLITPPLELQNQFAEKIKNIEAQKALVKQQAQQSEDLFQALLQESFNF